MNEIVHAAREYLGTPYHHQGRRKGVGIDCVGLIVCVARDTKRLPLSADVQGYSRIPDGESLMHHLHNHLEPVDKSEMRPGDVVCVAYDKWPQHVGILGNYLHGGLSIIHACNHRGAVIETRLMFSQFMRYVAAFRFREPSEWLN